MSFYQNESKNGYSSTNDGWVDKIISTHKQKLDGFRKCKHCTGCEEKKERSINTLETVESTTTLNLSNTRNIKTPTNKLRESITEPSTNYFYQRNSLSPSIAGCLPSESPNSPQNKIDENSILNNSTNSDLPSLKNSQSQKFIDRIIEENAELKLKLQVSEKDIEALKLKSTMIEKEYQSNSQIFYDRERDLIETIKIIDIENQQLKEKINNMRLEMTKKTKDLEMALSINESVINNKFYAQINNNNSSNTYSNKDNLNNSTLSNKKGQVDEDYLFKCLKLEKIIEIFINFFIKFEITREMSTYVRNFDFDVIKSKLSELEEFLKKQNAENKDRGRGRGARGATPSSEKDSFNLNTESSQGKNCNSDKKIPIEQDFLERLDNRLKQLEMNVGSIIKKKPEPKRVDSQNFKTQNFIPQNLNPQNLNNLSNMNMSSTPMSHTVSTFNSDLRKSRANPSPLRTSSKPLTSDRNTNRHFARCNTCKSKGKTSIKKEDL